MTTVRTILVMDDNPDICTTLQDILELSGYDVTTAENGNVGLDLAREMRPDLMIVDLMMPGCSGLSVVKRMRRLGVPQIPIVMMSINGSPQQHSYALALGANEFLQKPFGLGELVDVVQTLCPLDDALIQPRMMPDPASPLINQRNP